MSASAAQFVYALAWASFGAVHSLLAHPPVRRAMGRVCGPATRLTYNVIATLHLAGVLLLGHALLGAGADFALPGPLLAAMWSLSGVGLAVLAAGLREYDLGRFAGTWQLRHGVAPAAEAASQEDEPLVTGGLHRYVRHPLYSGALALLWGLAQDPFGLATALWGSLYILIGTWFEERKLVARHGAAYRRYRRRVPAFVPWRGRVG